MCEPQNVQGGWCLRRSASLGSHSSQSLGQDDDHYEFHSEEDKNATLAQLSASQAEASCLRSEVNFLRQKISTWQTHYKENDAKFESCLADLR